jgi:hypothetical protein
MSSQVRAQDHFWFFYIRIWLGIEIPDVLLVYESNTHIHTHHTHNQDFLIVDAYWKSIKDLLIVDAYWKSNGHQMKINVCSHTLLSVHSFSDRYFKGTLRQGGWRARFPIPDPWHNVERFTVSQDSLSTCVGWREYSPTSLYGVVIQLYDCVVCALTLTPPLTWTCCSFFARFVYLWRRRIELISKSLCKNRVFNCNYKTRRVTQWLQHL